MTTFGVDYAWGRPSTTALKKAGVQFCARYLSHDTAGKNLTRSEAQRLTDAGINLVVVWESTASRALAGHAAGAQDARDALKQALGCGMPHGRPIFFAVDFDATHGQLATIMEYLDGAATIIGREHVGLYGGYQAVHYAMNQGIPWGWQTYAWSGGRWDVRAQIRQYSNDHTIDGVDLDYDHAMKADYGQWRIGYTPTRTVPTTQTPKTTDTHTEREMPYGQLADGPQAITPISLHKGSYRAIGFLADNGLQGLPPAELRVAVHDGKGWHIKEVVADSTKDKSWFYFEDGATTDGVSVQRKDDGAVHVAWDVA